MVPLCFLHLYHALTSPRLTFQPSVSPAKPSLGCSFALRRSSTCKPGGRTAEVHTDVRSSCLRCSGAYASSSLVPSLHLLTMSSTVLPSPLSSSIPFFAALLPLRAYTPLAALALVSASSSSPSPHRAYLHPLTRGRPRQGPCCQPIRPPVANIAASTPRFRRYTSSLASSPCLERSISSASTRPAL